MTQESDKTYTVQITATAERGFVDHALFIAEQERDAEPGRAWLARARAAAHTLGRLPRRWRVAEGYERVGYEVRRLILRNHLILFTVDEAAGTVYVVGVIRGSRRPRPGDLPPSPADDAGEETRI